MNVQNEVCLQIIYQWWTKNVKQEKIINCFFDNIPELGLVGAVLSDNKAYASLSLSLSMWVATWSWDWLEAAITESSVYTHASQTSYSHQRSDSVYAASMLNYRLEHKSWQTIQLQLKKIMSWKRIGQQNVRTWKKTMRFDEVLAAALEIG